MVSYVLRYRNLVMVIISRMDGTVVGDFALKVHATASLNIIVCYYLAVGQVWGAVE